MPSTLPSNFVSFAQVDIKISIMTSFDEPCMFEESLNSKDEFTNKKEFLVNYPIVHICTKTPAVIKKVCRFHISGHMITIIPFYGKAIIVIAL